MAPKNHIKCGVLRHYDGSTKGRLILFDLDNYIWGVARHAPRLALGKLDRPVGRAQLAALGFGLHPKEQALVLE
jgi:hypothetical protein